VQDRDGPRKVLAGWFVFSGPEFQISLLFARTKNPRRSGVGLLSIGVALRLTLSLPNSSKASGGTHCGPFERDFLGCSGFLGFEVFADAHAMSQRGTRQELTPLRFSYRLTANEFFCFHAQVATSTGNPALSKG